MPTAILIILAASAVAAWIVLGDGAERVEGSIAICFILCDYVPDCPPSLIRFFAALAWLIFVGWTVLQFFYPSLKLL